MGQRKNAKGANSEDEIVLGQVHIPVPVSPPEYKYAKEDEKIEAPPSYDDSQLQPPPVIDPPDHPHPHQGDDKDDPEAPPPDYSLGQGHQSPSDPPDAAGTVYPRFPPLMALYNFREWSIASSKALRLCGATEEDPLYIATLHTGFAGNPLLGTRPGIILRNGLAVKDPAVAAAADGLRLPSLTRRPDPDGVLILPGLPSSGTATVAEYVCAATTPDGRAAFRFVVEVGSDETARREEFEWEEMRKGSDDSATGGFRLSRRVSGAGDVGAGGSSAADPADKGGGEGALAVLRWAATGSFFVRKREFILELKGDGLDGALGERWALAVVMTALRLWWLRVSSRASKVVGSKGDKVGTKGKS